MDIHIAGKIRNFRVKDGQFFLRQNKEMCGAADGDIFDNAHYRICLRLPVVTGKSHGIPHLIGGLVDLLQGAA